MKKRTFASLLGVAIFSMGTQLALAKHQKVDWGYTGQTGPEHWGSLSSEYELCAAGKKQSPIDLADFNETDLPPIKFNYSSNAKEIVNNGHSIQANYTPGSSITIDGQEFSLQQFHFHSPSENHIKGKSFPMEVHLVHADKNKNLAVVAVMFEEGETNSTIADLWNQMPEKAGDKQALSSSVNAMSLLPESKDYYSFSGSLTTPPCSEGVKWMVMKQAISVSKSQVEAFTGVMGHPNNRPIQPPNDRVIQK